MADLDEKYFVSKNEFDDLRRSFESLSSELELKKHPIDRLCIINFSGTLDKLLAAFIIATGAAATGTDVHLFFTFWGTSALRKKTVNGLKKSFINQLFDVLLPKGPSELPLSNFNFCGLGPKLIKKAMKDTNTSTLEDMFKLASDLNIKIHVCEMSMSLMGINREEIIQYPDLDYIGVAKFLEYSHEGKSTLFI